MTSTLGARLAASGAFWAGIVHLWLAPHHLSDAPFFGLAFVLDGMGFILISGLLLVSGSRRVRRAAGLLGGATATGYLVAHSVGLPGLHRHDLDPVGLVTTAIEIALFAWTWPQWAALSRSFGMFLRRRMISACAAGLAAVLVSGVMVAANGQSLPVPTIPATGTTPQPSSSGSQDPNLERSKPPGCLAITKRINLYAQQIPSAEGVRLGYGTAPGKATIPGPFIELEEGDCVAITLRNDVPKDTLESLKFDAKTPTGVSLHVHGVKYTPASDGTAHHQSFVPPGESRTFIWYAAPRVTVEGRVVSLGTAGYWWYHDHVVGSTHGTKGVESGLFGGMVVRRKGDIKPHATHTVVMGPNATINLQKNPPPFEAKEGERVEFVVLNVGDDFHTFHLHAHNWADNRTGFLKGPSDETQLIDAKTIGPSESFGFQVIAGEEVGAGQWMLHCHVQSHSDRGMATYFKVNRTDGIPLPDVAHH